MLEVKFLNRDYFIVCSNSDTLRVVNNKTKDNSILTGHRDIITCSDLNPKNFLITGSKDGKILLWEINQTLEDSPSTFENDKIVSNAKPEIKLLKKYKGHMSYVVTLSIGQKTGNVFISCGGDGMLKLWNISKQSCKSIKPHTKEINFARMSRNEKFVISGSHDRSVILYSATNLKVLKELKEHTKGVWDGEFAPFEMLFATGSSDQLIKIWDLKMIADFEKQKKKTILGENYQENLDNQTKIIEEANRSSRKNLKSNVNSKMSKDKEERMLVKEVLNQSGTGNDHAQNLLNQIIGQNEKALASPECLRTLEGHESPVVRVKWINLGLQIISGDSQGAIKLWNFRKAVCLYTIHKHEGKIWALDVYESFKFGNDKIDTQNTEDIQILSGDNNSTLFLWKDNTQEIEVKNLADRQRRKVIHDEIEMKIKESNFEEAIEICFSREMNSWFFKTIERWQKKAISDWVIENILFSFDDYCQQLYHNLIEQKEINIRQQIFVDDLTNLICKLFDLDAPKLLNMCQAFITHTKYAWTVQIILFCLFKQAIEVKGLASLFDKLKKEKIDLKRVFRVFMNFSEKMLKRNERQSRIVAGIGFELKRNMLIK